MEEIRPVQLMEEVLGGINLAYGRLGCGGDRNRLVMEGGGGDEGLAEAKKRLVCICVSTDTACCTVHGLSQTTRLTGR